MTGAALVIAVSSVLLYFNIKGSGGSGSGEIVGELFYKRNVAQRKYFSDVVWDDLDKREGSSIPLYNLDTIRTADVSEAEIRLKDGTKILLDANSMIVLDISRDSANIKFMAGSISASRTGGGGADLNIVSNASTIKIADSDVKLTGQGEGVSVEVSRGQASVQTGSSQQNVDSNHVAVLSGSTVQVQQVSLRPLTPGDNARLFTSEGRQRVNFSWEAVKNVPSVQFLLGKDRAFQDTVFRREVDGNGVSADLDSGVYYWRIQAQNPSTGNLETGPVFRLSVIKNEGISLISPAAETRIDYVTREPLVNFSWSRNDFASGYKITIARDRGMQNRVQELSSTSASISLPLAAGDYFWRVDTVSNMSDASVASSVQSFTIVRREKAKAPVPISPESDRKIGKAFVQRQGITFNWSAGPELSGAVFQIARDAQFGQMVASEDCRNNFVQVKRDLPQGTYFWRVAGRDDAGNSSDFSDVRSFQIVTESKLTTQMPETNAEFDVFSAKNLAFRWERPDLVGSFRIIIAKSPDLRNPEIQQVVTSNSFTAATLSGGRYYWKVQLIAEHDEVISESDTLNFSITDSIRDVAARFPAPGSVVDMTYRNALAFNWDASPGADLYHFTLYQIDKNDARIPIVVVDTDRKEYVLTDLTRLDKGQFLWSVVAMRSTARDMRSKEVFYPFTITLTDDSNVPQFVSPQRQYVR